MARGAAHSSKVSHKKQSKEGEEICAGNAEGPLSFRVYNSVRVNTLCIYIFLANYWEWYSAFLMFLVMKNEDYIRDKHLPTAGMIKNNHADSYFCTSFIKQMDNRNSADLMASFFCRNQC